ncbi:hypothetical protein B0J15DRAFT_473254 [Fusarium solani]|uniref:Uncharacterized protein n=1 Tax=Fusarium solani TaxID=169388 RepID=A0A9P9JUY5_FUSSL|nr:uncharacterized protein B0J15DRAFT_473254 [Fusarium solani]KAH7228626.1 hypothetical protein B0J15DRAFT_473254 [Fusarium solani]
MPKYLQGPAVCTGRRTVRACGTAKDATASLYKDQEEIPSQKSRLSVERNNGGEIIRTRQETRRQGRVDHAWKHSQWLTAAMLATKMMLPIVIPLARGHKTTTKTSGRARRAGSWRIRAKREVYGRQKHGLGEARK